jgi:endoglucanase
MKNILKTGIITFVLLLGFSMIVVGCDDKNNTVTVTSVSISPSAAFVAQGTTQAFTAGVTETNEPAQAVTWSIVQTNKDSGTTIDENGVLTVAAVESLTSLTVKATLTADTSKSGTASVTISDGSFQIPSAPQPFNDITAAQLAADIKVGWNLGNTLDTYNITGHGPNPTVSQFETGWGNPVTTKAMITAVKDAGFNAIRIPVSWAKCADSNYIIRADWMARVTEVVNYAVDNDMYILLNTHHDENVFKFTNAQKTASITAFRKIWGQIATNFKNYNEKLVFEGLNEPRTKGSSAEWNGGTADERANLNQHYKAFVETVRTSGGNNDKRILMINTYGASGLSTAMSGLTIPADTAQNKIIVSYHAYEPYDFALNEKSPIKTWSQTSSDTAPITSRVDTAYSAFVSKGVPVIMGEFGALDKSNEEARAAWVEYYVKYAAGKGIKCFWWDDGGNFKLFNRRSNSFYFPLIKDAIMRGAE